MNLKKTLTILSIMLITSASFAGAGNEVDQPEQREIIIGEYSEENIIFNFFSKLFKGKKEIMINREIPYGINALTLRRNIYIVLIDEDNLYFVEEEEPLDRGGPFSGNRVERMGCCTKIETEALKKELPELEIDWITVEESPFVFYYSIKHDYRYDTYYANELYYIKYNNSYYKLNPSNYDDKYWVEYYNIKKRENAKETFKLFGLE